MSQRSAARVAARRTLSHALVRTLGGASAIAIAVAVASVTPAAASTQAAHTGHATAKHAKSHKSANASAKTSAKASASRSAAKARAHAHASSAHTRHESAHRARGRHPHASDARASDESLVQRAIADSRAAVPRVPIVPVIDLHVAGAPASAPASASATAAASSRAFALASVPGSDTLAGRSGKLRARFLVPSAAVAATFAGAARSIAGLFPYLRRVFGDTAAQVAPGVYSAPVADGRPPFAFITMLPFSEKVAGRIGDYRIGFWPGETARRLTSSYGNPMGFIEVTAANQATYVSEHFQLGDFLTHDQQNVWPKYLVLHEQLLDKLELVLDDLRAHGYKAERLHVMSGFRTPQYNQSGGDPSGRAELSRHQYGDAADVWVENGSGTMADLNGDGRIDARDAAVLAAAADRVEQAHPALVGGVGIYQGNGAHGPFVHIDTRGARARWGHG